MRTSMIKTTNKLVTINEKNVYLRCDEEPEYTFYSGFPSMCVRINGKLVWHNGKEVAKDFCESLCKAGLKAELDYNGSDEPFVRVTNEGIYKHINGYEYVSDVKKVTYGEYTPQDFLFVVDRNDRLNPTSIVEVAPNIRGTYDELKSRWDTEKYKIEFGTIWNWPNGGEIEYHWS